MSVQEYDVCLLEPDGKYWQVKQYHSTWGSEDAAGAAAGRLLLHNLAHGDTTTVGVIKGAWDSDRSQLVLVVDPQTQQVQRVGS